VTDSEFLYKNAKQWLCNDTHMHNYVQF